LFAMPRILFGLLNILTDSIVSEEPEPITATTLGKVVVAFISLLIQRSSKHWLTEIAPLWGLDS
jgi:hypothetical protein